MKITNYITKINILHIIDIFILYIYIKKYYISFFSYCQSNININVITI